MNKIKYRFILADFLGYLFPGISTLLAIWFIFSVLSPDSDIVKNIKLDIASSVVGVALAYVLGVVASSLASLFNLDKGGEDDLNPLTNKHLTQFRYLIETEFVEAFGAQDKWNINQFYMMRAFLQQFAPDIIAIPERQNALRQLRRNIIIPSIVWGLALLFYGLQEIVGKSSVTDSDSIVLPILSLVMGVVLVIGSPFALNRGRRRNRAFEVRDNVMHFLLLRKFGNTDKEVEQVHSADAKSGAADG